MAGLSVPSGTGRRLLLALLGALLLVLAWGALAGAVRQLPRAGSPGQLVQTALQLGAGALTLLVVPSRAAAAWRRPVAAAWLCTLAAAAGMSSLVWGPPMAGIALLFAAAAVLFALGMLRAIDFTLRGAVRTGGEPAG